MKRTKLLGVPLTAGLMTAALLSPPGTVQLAELSGPQLLGGVLLDKSGDPIPRAELTVYVNERTSEGDLTWPLAEGQTNPHGKFLIRGKLGKRAEKASFNPDGTVSLEVRVVTATDEKFFNLDALPPAPGKGRPDWVWGEVVDQNLVQPGNSRGAFAKAQERSDKALGGITFQMEEESPDIAPMAASTRCRYTYPWIADTQQKRYVPLVLINKKNRTWQKFLWKTTSKSKFEYVWEEGGDAWGGGLTFSHEQAKSPYVNAVFKQDEGPFEGQTKTRWIYQKQRQICIEQTLSQKDNVWVDNGKKYPTGKRRWKARFWEGGNKDFENGLWWKCDPEYRTPIDHEIGVEEGKTASHGASVKLSGYKASVTQTTATNVTWAIGPGGSFSKARVCGRGNYVSKAAQIKEVAW